MTGRVLFKACRGLRERRRRLSSRKLQEFLEMARMLQSEGIWRVRKYVFGVFLLVSFAVSMIAARSVVLVDDLGSLSAYAFVIAAGAYNIAVLAIFRWWRDRSRLVFFIVGAVGVISGAGIGIARPLAHSVESLSYAVAFLSLATVLHLVLTVILMAGSSES